MLRTLVSHQNWGTAANESLYIMCNNLEDVKTLESDYVMQENSGKVRCEYCGFIGEHDSESRGSDTAWGLLPLRVIRQSAMG